MTLNHAVSPVSWRKVALVIVPGLLFGISRVFSSLGWPAGFSFLLVTLLALGKFVVQRRFPIWGLLAAGLLTGWALQWISFLLPGELARGLLTINHPATYSLGSRLIFSPTMQRFIIAVPIWLAIIWLLWTYRRFSRTAAWAILLSGLIVVGASILINVNILLYTGLVLLPVTLGLPLARQYGPLASLYMLGVLSALVLFDSDYYSGSIVNTQPFYPLYVIPLIWLMVAIAPLFLMRARTPGRQFMGLWVPTLVWGIARIAVPVMIRSDFHSLSVWLGDALLSAFILIVLALSFYLYAQSGKPTIPSKAISGSRAVFS